MKKLQLLLVLAINILTVYAQNLLINPGFETWQSGTPAGWSVSNNNCLYQDTSIKNEGTMACKVNTLNAGSDVNIFQNIPVTPGKTYTLRLSYYVASGDGTDVKILSYFRDSLNTPIKMSIEDSLALKGPGGNGAYFASLPGSWNTYTCDVVAPAKAGAFVFYVRSAGYSNTVWDNFYFGENTTPTVYSNKTSLNGFTYVPGNGPSAEQSFTVKGNNLTGSVTVTAPASYEISVMSGADFAGTNSLTIARSGTRLNTLPIYVRLKAGLPKNIYTGNITISSPGATPLNIPLSGEIVEQPVVMSTSVSNLTGFTYGETKGPSAMKSFTVKGSGLTSNIVVTASEHFEISVLSGESFTGTSSFTLAQSGGSIPPTTIYVRLKSGLKEASYSGNISLTTTGASQNIELSGKVTAIPGITITPKTLTGFSYQANWGPSEEQMFTVSGAGLTSFLIITAPSEFEISTESGTAFAGTNQLIMPQSGGIVATTPVYVRLKSGLPVNSYSGNVNILTSGNPTQTVYVEGKVLQSTVTNLPGEPNQKKIYCSFNNIVVEGTGKNEIISVYTPTGICVKSIISDETRICIEVKPNSVYLVRIGSKITKVIL